MRDIADRDPEEGVRQRGVGGLEAAKELHVNGKDHHVDANGLRANVEDPAVDANEHRVNAKDRPVDVNVRSLERVGGRVRWPAFTST